MDNGISREVIDHFNAISSLPDVWDHNQQYHKFLLQQLPAQMNTCLEIGCGKGEFTRTLAMICRNIVGIDVSNKMVEEAAKRSGNANVEYKNISSDDYFRSNTIKFDLIVTIATLHHLDMENTFQSIKNSLSPRGIFIVLDLYKIKSVYEYLLSFFATILNPLFYLIKRGRLKGTKEEIEAWGKHAGSDSYNTFREVRHCASGIFGACEMKHHLFWRYSLIYRNINPASSV